MFNKISVKAGLVALLGLMTLLLLLVSIIGGVAIQQDARSLQQINQLQGEEMNSVTEGYNNTLRVRTAAALAIRQMETGMTDDAQKTTGRIAIYLQRADQNMADFKASDHSGERGEALAQAVDAAYSQYREKGLATLLATLQQSKPDDYYELLEHQISQYSNPYDAAIANFRAFGKDLGEESVNHAVGSAHFKLTIIIIACLLVLALVVLAWFALKQIILRPLEQVMAHLEHMAAGDLTRPVPLRGNTEIGRLGHALANMQGSLAESVSRVRNAANQIDTGARELSAGNINLAARTEESAASLEQTAASMEELTSTVRMNAQNTEQANALAESVSAIASKGSDVVSEVMEKMRAITHSSQRIGDIITVMDGISFQTNILALNAAVEAARAGEQGRGFAVVAGEVRNLAQRSAQSAKEIKTLIGDSEARVKEGRQMVEGAAQTMSEIAEEVGRVTTLMREISTATHEQSNGIGQVNQAVTQMDQVAQQNAALVEQAAAATASLEEQARLLAEIMAGFKVGR
ncbi:methyl-accepting chemotaxis protein [Nissabacter sp. SGAir0207]|uniref:methyl-accepting chemotaxis protein n=1 Tax=Nissabacter sp. SGAir0207 TaxID=2126321 RepID=UPI0010CD2D0B|nr:methyl-accepting chemotaxis protein [Nissabacter sp. SGAir0207]QCR34931.1 methyl-accepting chemotaxis protein [Nissabacter sp. SGAir0207]